MPGDSFKERRARVREDVDRTVQGYSKIARVCTDAVKGHADAAVNYVTDLFDRDNDQSGADLVKDGLGLWIGCCRRQMKMWHDLCDAVHGGADVEPPAQTVTEPPESGRTGATTRPQVPIVLPVDAEAETTGIFRTPFRVEEFGTIVPLDLWLEDGTALVPRANVLLSESDRSAGFLMVSVFGLRQNPPLPLGKYVGSLVGPSIVVQLTVIRS